MSVVSTTEATALAAALSEMLTAPADELARHARIVSRAADDVEVAAAETADASVRHALMEQVDAARGAAASAREQARWSALANGRKKLLEGALQRKQEDDGAAAVIAREINDGLRRVTAVVQEEVERSRAAGGVMDESGRRLRMTGDQHVRYRDKLRSGAGTLSELKRVDLVASVAVILSFLFFFLVTGYVVSRRLANSNTATYLVRPMARIVYAPVRVMVKLFQLFARITTKRAARRPVVTGAEDADVKKKAQEGREDLSFSADTTDHVDEALGNVIGNLDANTASGEESTDGFTVDTASIQSTDVGVLIVTEESEPSKQDSSVFFEEELPKSVEKGAPSASIGSGRDSSDVTDGELSVPSHVENMMTMSRQTESLIDTGKMVHPLEHNQKENNNLLQEEVEDDYQIAGHEDL